MLQEHPFIRILLRSWLFAIVLLVLVLSFDDDAYSGHGATNVMRQNLAQLTQTADIILVGKVLKMTDGLAEHNLPDTEIRFEVHR